MTDNTVVRPPARGLAVMQAAEAMLRALGGVEITVLFPGTAAASSLEPGLGLQDPSVDEIVIAPVCSVGTGMKGEHVQTEFVLAASAIDDLMATRGSDSAETFFESALGIVSGGKLLRVVSVTPETYAGTAYLYRVTATE